MGVRIGAFKGDTRNVDCSSYNLRIRCPDFKKQALG